MHNASIQRWEKPNRRVMSMASLKVLGSVLTGIPACDVSKFLDVNLANDGSVPQQ
jgi:hypothetical protein